MFSVLECTFLDTFLMALTQSKIVTPHCWYFISIHLCTTTSLKIVFVSYLNPVTLSILINNISFTTRLFNSLNIYIYVCLFSYSLNHKPNVSLYPSESYLKLYIQHSFLFHILCVSSHTYSYKKMYTTFSIIRPAIHRVRPTHRLFS